MSTGSTCDGGVNYAGGWVAEVALIHPLNDSLETFLRIRQLNLKLLRAKQSFLRARSSGRLQQKAGALARATARVNNKIARLQERLRKVGVGLAACRVV